LDNKTGKAKRVPKWAKKSKEEKGKNLNKELRGKKEEKEDSGHKKAWGVRKYKDHKFFLAARKNKKCGEERLGKRRWHTGRREIQTVTATVIL